MSAYIDYTPLGVQIIQANKAHDLAAKAQADANFWRSVGVQQAAGDRASTLDEAAARRADTNWFNREMLAQADKRAMESAKQRELDRGTYDEQARDASERGWAQLGLQEDRNVIADDAATRAEEELKRRATVDAAKSAEMDFRGLYAQAQAGGLSEDAIGQLDLNPKQKAALLAAHWSSMLKALNQTALQLPNMNLDTMKQEWMKSGGAPGKEPSSWLGFRQTVPLREELMKRNTQGQVELRKKIESGNKAAAPAGGFVRERGASGKVYRVPSGVPSGGNEPMPRYDSETDARMAGHVDGDEILAWDPESAAYMPATLTSD